MPAPVEHHPCKYQNESEGSRIPSKYLKDRKRTFVIYRADASASLRLYLSKVAKKRSAKVECIV